MKQWLAKIQEQAHDLSTVHTMIIPSEKMRHAFERILLGERKGFYQVQFLTFYEWVLTVTEQKRYEEQLRLITYEEQLQWVSQAIKQYNRAELAAHQQQLVTADAILTELLFLREHGLNEAVVHPNMQALFQTLLKAYEGFLVTEQASDYADLLQYILKEKPAITEKLVSYPNDKLTILEQEICTVYGIQTVDILPLERETKIEKVEAFGFDHAVEDALQAIISGEHKADESFFVYTDPALLRTIYEKTKKYHVPTTFAQGIPLEWTEAYYFLATIIDYIENDRPSYLLQHLANDHLLNVDGEKVSPYLINRLVTEDGISTGPRLRALLADKLHASAPEKFYQENKAALTALYIQMSWLESKDVYSLSPAEQMTYLGEVMEHFYRVRGQADGKAYAVIQQVLEPYKEGQMMLPSTFRLSDVLTLVAGKSIQVENEQAGHLHVAAIHDVGPIYRAHYYWFGLSTEAFLRREAPTAFIDKDRLPLGVIQTEEARLLALEEDFAWKVRKAGGAHSLYFTSYNVEKNQQNNPILTWQILQDVPSRSIGFGESQLLASPFNNVHTTWQEAAVDIPLASRTKEIPEKLFRFSPTSATDLTKCSRKFMYENILRLREKVVEPISYHSWLPPHLLGNAYHQLLEMIVEEKIREEAVILEKLDQVFATYEALYPPIYEQLVDDEKARAQEVLAAFIARLDEKWEMSYTELQFGSEAPLVINISNEDKPTYIQIRGFIDRVDVNRETQDHRVVDYKTGKSSSILQIVLYEQALKAMFAQENISIQPFDSYFDFIFTNKVNTGERARSEPKPAAMDRLVTAIEDFHDHWDTFDTETYKRIKNDICSYCSFQSVCSMREEQQDE